MKKIFVLVLSVASLSLSAHFPAFVDVEESKGLISDLPATPLQLGVGFFERAQIFDGSIPCFAALGLLGLLQQSAVVSFAPGNMLQSNYLLQCGLLNVSENNWIFAIAPCNLAHNNYGVQAGLFNFSNVDRGIQAGLFNIGGMIQIGLCNSNGDFQIGLLNYNPKAWIPWMPLVNFCFREK